MLRHIEQLQERAEAMKVEAFQLEELFDREVQVRVEG